MTEPKELTLEEANKLISEYCKEAYAAIKKAEEIAVKHNITFSFDISYGMGGTFFPQGDEYYTIDSDPTWVASSHMC